MMVTHLIQKSLENVWRCKIPLLIFMLRLQTKRGTFRRRGIMQLLPVSLSFQTVIHAFFNEPKFEPNYMVQRYLVASRTSREVRSDDVPPPPPYPVVSDEWTKNHINNTMHGSVRMIHHWLELLTEIFFLN